MKNNIDEMKIILIVGFGGFIGTIMRYLISHFLLPKEISAFPFGTLSVNLIGCFVIGLLMALNEKAPMSNEWRFFLGAGICGGFTTFSTFSVETLALFRTGQYGIALMYVLASVVVGLLATVFGYVIARA